MKNGARIETLGGDVDAILCEYVTPDSPGAAVLLARGGEILLQRGYGLADVEERVPITAGTRFIIASVTKQFTAAAVMLLARDGALDYDETVARYIGQLPAWRDRVSIRHLLTHTSGIPDYLSRQFWEEARERDFTLNEVLRRIRGCGELEFSPGCHFGYSNSGYVLLGRIVEKVSGEPFSSFLRDRIFRPLDMTDTLVGEEADPYPDQAAGYHREEGEEELRRAPYNRTVVGWADGNIISTVGDLYRWDQALYGEGLLPEEMLREAFTPFNGADPTFSRYGFGWLINRRRGLREIWHAGGTVGYSSQLRRYPEQRAAVILLSNAGDLDPQGDLVGALAEVLLEDQMRPEPTPVRLGRAELRKMTGTYVPALPTQRERGEILLRVSEDGGLRVSDESDFFPGLALIPVGDGFFRTDNRADHYIHFLQDAASGAIVGLRYDGSGSVHNFCKM